MGVKNLVDDLVDPCPLGGQLSAEDLIEDDAEAIEIGAAVDVGSPLDLFG